MRLGRRVAFGVATSLGFVHVPALVHVSVPDRSVRLHIACQAQFPRSDSNLPSLVSENVSSESDTHMKFKKIVPR